LMAAEMRKKIRHGEKELRNIEAARGEKEPLELKENSKRERDKGNKFNYIST